MQIINRLSHQLKRCYIKFFHWEYWPMWVVYFPVSFYYVYLSIKSRSFFFFSASNPSIETGGMFFESKWEIFKLMPAALYPTTLFIDSNDDFISIITKLKAASLNYPLIAKPNRGERGWLVKKINSEEDLKKYWQSVKVDFLIQAYINYPIELSIFYYRHPKADRGAITSVTLKKLLSVTGDGEKNIQELVKASPRAFLQYEKLFHNPNIDFNKVLPKAEELILVPYGNHVLGATFLNYQNIIDEDLNLVIDLICKQIKGFYFGRFDLRCNSIEDLKKGKNFSILELNGAGAEPAHIYDPSFSFFKAQLVLANHYRMMYLASKENNKLGAPFMTLQNYKKLKKAEKAYKLKGNNA